jgi:peptide/nickel transport system substrate-binding protein
MNNRWSVTCVLIIFALILSACGGGVATQPATQEPVVSSVPTTQEEISNPTSAPVDTPLPQEPRVLKVATTANFTTWDPVKSFSTEAIYMVNFYEGLLRINPPGSSERFTPLLAEKWDVSPDALVWTFYLRKGVTFHDGEPLTAEAVKKSIEAAKDHAGASFIWAPLSSIDVVDDLTVKFTLSYAAPVDLIASSLYGAWIVSPKALDAAAQDGQYFEAGIEAGTGPYMLESYEPDKEVLMTRFDNYWGGWSDVSHFDKILMLITPEAVQQQQMFESGEVDLALSLPLENVSQFKDNPDFTFTENTSSYNYLGFFNTLRKPLDDPKVRQALSYAIPYDDIIKIGAQTYGKQARGPVPEGIWPYSKDVPQYTQDLTKAADLLKEAGHAGGGFELNLTYAAENQAEERIAPLIKDAFAEIGVTVNIEAIQFNQQWEKAKADPANAQDIFLLLYWPTYSDAGTDNLWSLFHSSEAPFFNLSYWKDEAFDNKIDEAASLTVTDPTKAQQLYTEAMTQLVDQAPGFFLYDVTAVTVIPQVIKGYEYNMNYPFTTFFYPLYSE